MSAFDLAGQFGAPLYQGGDDVGPPLNCTGSQFSMGNLEATQVAVPSAKPQGREAPVSCPQQSPGLFLYGSLTAYAAT